MSNSGNNNLWLFLETLANRRGFIFLFTIILTVFCSALVFLLPNWYQATTLIMAPEKDSQPLVSFSGGDAFQGLDLSVMSTATVVYVRILTSLPVSNRVVDRLNLMERYNSENRQKAIEQLMYRSDIHLTGEGLIEVMVEDRDPQMAADIANAFVDELLVTTQEVIKQKAHAKVEFLSEQLDSAKTQLATAREALKNFQVEHKMVDFDEQTHLAIEEAIQVKIALAEAEVEIHMAEKTQGSNSPEVKEYKERQSILLKQLSDIETGGGKLSYLSLPLASIPVLKTEYQQLYSKVRVVEGLVSVLQQQLEQARIQEGAKPEFSVLQQALAPEDHYRPERPLIIVVTFFVSALLSIILSVFLDYMKGLRVASPDNHRRAMKFMQAYLGWFPGVRKRIENQDR